MVLSEICYALRILIQPRYLILPIHTNGNHWVLVIIDMIEKVIYYFDSYSQDWKEIALIVSRWITSILNISGSFKYVNVLNNAQQRDSSQCGMYLLHYLYLFMFDRKCSFDQSNDDLMKTRRPLFKQIIK